MKLSKEEFDQIYMEGHEKLLMAMAEHPGIDIQKFYSMACFLENLTFFTPFLYSILLENKKDE